MIYNDRKDALVVGSIKVRVLNNRCLAFPRGLGGVRELREACRNHFHLSWYLQVPVVTSYGQKRSWRDFFHRVRYLSISSYVTKALHGTLKAHIAV